MGLVVQRFDIFLVSLDPTLGSEIKKTCPCVVISPNEMNFNIRTVIVAPMTTKGRSYPSRVPCSFNNKQSHIVLDQIRTIDKQRLVKQLGQLNSKTAHHVLSVLQNMFA